MQARSTSDTGFSPTTYYFLRTGLGSRGFPVETRSRGHPSDSKDNIEVTRSTSEEGPDKRSEDVTRMRTRERGYLGDVRLEVESQKRVLGCLLLSVPSSRSLFYHVLGSSHPPPSLPVLSSPPVTGPFYGSQFTIQRPCRRSQKGRE